MIKSLSVVCAVIALVSVVPTAVYAEHSGGGRLIIKRSPDMGNTVYVAVWIDGAKAGTILYAQSYERAVPAGRHLITVQLEPGQRSYLPSSMNLNVQAGHTYQFMAVKKGGTLALAKL